MPKCMDSCLEFMQSKVRVLSCSSFHVHSEGNLKESSAIKQKHELEGVQAETRALREETQALREDSQAIKCSIADLELRTNKLFIHVQTQTEHVEQHTSPDHDSPVSLDHLNIQCPLPNEWPKMPIR